jgi:hypothetical protein
MVISSLAMLETPFPPLRVAPQRVACLAFAAIISSLAMLETPFPPLRSVFAFARFGGVASLRSVWWGRLASLGSGACLISSEHKYLIA